jgi:hypothetical protein
MATNTAFSIVKEFLSDLGHVLAKKHKKPQTYGRIVWRLLCARRRFPWPIARPQPPLIVPGSKRTVWMPKASRSRLQLRVQ